MNIVASIYTISADQSQVTAFTDRVAAGSLIGHVVSIKDVFYFVSDDNPEKIYGEGEYVNPVLKMNTRATIAARRHFGRNILVF